MSINNFQNPLFLCDGYKLDHRRQYPKGTTRVYSNFTPRASRIAGQSGVIVFGIQYFLDRYFGELMNECFFNRNVDEVCNEYQEFLNGYLGPNDIGTDHIRALHNLGYLPLSICALPEGTFCDLRVPFFSIENTHEDFAWLPNYFETIISAIIWQPITSATLAVRLRVLLNRAAATSGDPSFVQWQGHDFSFRGMSSLETALISAAGHLLAFTGTDTVPAIPFINRYYPGKNGFIGGSVAATEHSVMSAGGKESEIETFERLLALYPSGIVSVVSDTWDLWNVLTNILPTIKNQILARNGKLVIRPDSGDPVKIICGDPDSANPAARKGVIELLWDVFGGTKNEKGFKVLDSHIGAIYGDAINYGRADEITQGLIAKGFASTNIVFGVGSFTYQYNTRDTFGFAMKATWAEVEGVGRDLFKCPVTDDGTKFSAKGRLAVSRGEDGRLILTCNATLGQELDSLLIPVWKDGKFQPGARYSFSDVRKNVEAYIAAQG